MSWKSRPHGTYKAPAHRVQDPLLILPGSSKGLAPEHDVNHRLHRLRGEQFRHQLNVRRAIAAKGAPKSGPTLPYGQIFGHTAEPLSAHAAETPLTPNTAGPVPRSWVPPTPSNEPNFSTAEWRTSALSLFFVEEAGSEWPNSDLSIQPLQLLCVRALLDAYGADAESLAELRPYLPPAACRLLLRDTAMHLPLANGALNALFAPDGHAGGEVIVVGPAQTLRPELLRSSSLDGPESVLWDQKGKEKGASDVMEEWEEEEEEEWDVADSDRPSAYGLALLSAPLTVSAIHALPPTLTRLALLRLPSPAPIHRLPDACPLLELLDISWNDWLTAPAWGEETALSRIRWGRWSHLRVLGVRETGLNEESEILKEVNEGRWVEGKDVVEIVA